jgi:hypothetical protein
VESPVPPPMATTLNGTGGTLLRETLNGPSLATFGARPRATTE